MNFQTLFTFSDEFDEIQNSNLPWQPGMDIRWNTPHQESDKKSAMIFFFLIFCIIIVFV